MFNYQYKTPQDLYIKMSHNSLRASPPSMDVIYFCLLTAFRCSLIDIHKVHVLLFCKMKLLHKFLRFSLQVLGSYRGKKYYEEELVLHAFSSDQFSNYY